MQRYRLPPESRMICLGDNSGVAIYSGYSSNTTFLINKNPQAPSSNFPDISHGITKSDLINCLSLTEDSADNLIQRLISEKVFWTE
ncbi:hypothetical protein [Aliiglaciecola aliphaticivorans]